MVIAAYLGVAEAARYVAVSQAAKKIEDPLVQEMVGEMDTELLVSRARCSA